MDITTTQIDHFGIVAGIFDQLGIAEVVDDKIPKLRHHKLTHSDVIKAMIINGLGFVNQRLYLFPEFYEKLPVERLIKEGIEPSDLNDDVLGRTLDAIYEYGPTDLFNEIILEVMSQLDLGTKIIHADTTSFSVHGTYEGHDGQKAIEITLGHSKDSRMDLKQFVLSLVTNQNGIPLFAKAYSGNASDKKTIIEAFCKVKDGLNFDSNAYYIGDSATYTEDNVQRLGKDILWITRVPATINEAKELLDGDFDMITAEDPRYAFYTTRSNYGGVEQRWVMFQSKPMHERMEKTFDKGLEKEQKAVQKSLNKMMRREFACEEDAIKEAELWLSTHQNYCFKDLTIKTVFKRAGNKKGRPKKDEKLVKVYIIRTGIELDWEMVEKAREKLGRFVLASNDPEIDPETMLKYYKGQQSVERGFRFLKDKSFHVAEVYLKKEERIEALAMIMVLCLLIYSIAEWKLRERLKETGETVPDQKDKPTGRPTMKWVFYLFRGVSEVVVKIGDEVNCEVANIKDVLLKILCLLGPECEKYYG